MKSAHTTPKEETVSCKDEHERDLALGQLPSCHLPRKYWRDLYQVAIRLNRSNAKEYGHHELAKRALQNASWHLRAFHEGDLSEPAKREGESADSKSVLPTSIEALPFILPDHDAKTEEPPALLGTVQPTSLSAMPSMEQLRSVVPFGVISPPCPRLNLNCDEFRVPLPTGAAYQLHPDREVLERIALLEGREQPPWTSPSQTKYAIRIILPENLAGNIIPVPIGADLCTLKAPDEREVQPPLTSEIALWRTSGEPMEVDYTVQFGGHPFTAAIAPELVQLLKPTIEEIRYWRSVLPLSADHQRLVDEALECQNDHLLAEVMTNWMWSHPSEGSVKIGSHLSRFRYVANARLGEFIRNHEQDLPIILSELKVGHCDLLSWYAAALLRSVGFPAWMTSEQSSTPDGTAINLAYGHARVVFADTKGAMHIFDPTLCADLDLRYDRSILGSPLIDRLEEDFSKASSATEKRKLLNNFHKFVIVPAGRRVQNAVKEGRFSLHRPESWVEVVDLEVRTLPSYSNLGSLPDRRLHLFPSRNSVLPNDLEGGIERAALLIGGRYEDWSEISLFREVIYGDSGTIASPLRRRELQQGLQELKINRARVLDSQSTLSIGAKDLFRGSQIPCPTLMNRRLLCSILDRGEPVRDQVAVAKWRLTEQDERDLKGGLFPLVCGTERNCIGFDWEPSSLGKGVRNFVAEYGIIHRFDEMMVETFSRRHGGLASPPITLPTNRPSHLKTVKDLIGSISLLQSAFIDRQSREQFLQIFGLSAQDLRGMAQSFLSWECPLAERSPGHLKRKSGWDLSLPELKKRLYLDSDCQRRLAGSFRKAIKHMVDSKAKTALPEPEEPRPYAPGDDLRYVDQKAWARTDKLYTKWMPRNQADFDTPLYVVLFPGGELTNALQTEVLLSVLQGVSTRQVYVTLWSASKSTQLAYFPIGQKRNQYPASEVYNCLQQGKGLSGGKARKRNSPAEANGTFPKNLLFVSEAPGLLYAAKYLYPHAETLWLDDERLDVYPLVRDDWVKELNS